MKKFVLLALMAFFLTLTSCVSKKEILYLNDLKSSDKSAFQWSEVIIQPNDILSVKITSDETELALPFNMNQVIGQQQNVNGAQLLLQGYLVSNEGAINIPVLGVVDVKGLTYTQVEDRKSVV